LHWSRGAILRQGFWSVVRFAIPLLLIASGFEVIFDGELQGVVWLIAAFGVAISGRVFLDRALGVNSRLLKSSELRNRALAMAERMDVDLRRVYIVPQGKGHLLNAFAGVSSISLTDTLSQHLNQAEVDCTIAHELGHLKLGHVWKTFLTLILVFAIPASLFFRLSSRMLPFRPVLDLLVILVPFLIFYFFSRRFEYQADQESVAAVENAEVEIRSLAKLHEAACAPLKINRVSELFLTHPSLLRRVAAIAHSNGVSGDRVYEILREVEPRKKRRAQDPVRS
ncbi:MAG: M48 family metallopeptidase, partial [Candidatus Acidiferrales bacterium]